MPRKSRPSSALWEQMPSKDRGYSHSNPNFTFLNDVQNDRFPLEDPAQEFLATTIQGAYNSGNPAGWSVTPSPELLKLFPGGVGPENVAEAESMLMRANYPKMLTVASRMENTQQGMGDLVSEMAVGFRGIVQSWDPNRGGFFQHMTNGLKNVAGGALRDFTSLGMGMDTGDPSGFNGITVNGPDPDRQVANMDFAGTSAPYSMPEKLPWYQNAAQGVGDNAVASPFYAPAGQGMFVQDQSGRTVINPQLTRNPGFNSNGAPRQGWEQASVTGEDLSGYSRTLDAYYAADKNKRVLDFGTGPQIKGVNSWLRGLNGQLRGGEFISTDAEVFGAVNGVDETFLRTHRSDPAVATGLTSNNVTVDGPLLNDAPALSVANATRDTLSTFSTPTEQLAISAAREATIVGRVQSNKINRWKSEVTAFEDKMVKASKYYDFEYNNPELARNQTLSWRNAKSAIEKHAYSEEALMDSIENDLSIPDQYKQQAFESAMSSHSYGKYGSQSSEVAAVADPWDQRAATPKTVGRLAANFRPISGGSSLDVPEMPTDFPENEPVSGVGNSEIASTETVQQVASATMPTPQNPQAAEITLRSQAQRARALLTGNKDFAEGYGQWIGRGAESSSQFHQWLGDVVGPEAPAAWDTLMAEKNSRAGLGGNSEFSNMIQSNPAWKTAHTQVQNKNNAAGTPPTQPATPPAGTASSNGSGGGGGSQPPATTSAPVDPEEGPSGFQYSNHPLTAQQQVNADASRAEMRELAESRAPELRANQAQNQRVLNADMRTRGVNPVIPRSDPSRLTNRPEDFPYQEEANDLNMEIGRETNFGEIPESVKQRMQRVGLARSLMSEIRPTKSLGGKTNGLYGDYDEVGKQFVGSGGTVTIGSEQIDTAQSMYEGAVKTAFTPGGFEGLSHKEIAATVHKRVGEALKTSLDQFEKEMKGEGLEPGAAKSIREKVQTVTGMMSREGDDAMASALSAGGFKDIAYTAQRLSRKDLKSLYENNTAFKQRVDELGGLDQVTNGASRVMSTGEDAYEIGEGGSRGGSGGWGDRIRSLYQTPVGHAMMAQFMASMAWKSTGGAVMLESDTWSKEQSKYNGLDAFGGGQLGAGGYAISHQQMATNTYGSLAYEQYGNLKDLGFALSQSQYGEGLGRFGNDAKMAAGVGAVAGIGTWGAGALLSSTALTAAAAPVGAAAAAAIGIPSIAMSGYNMFTGQDSYEGASWKNTMAGAAMRFGSVATGSLFEAGLPGDTGKGQEEWAQKNFGTSAREWFLSTPGGQKLGPGFANWMFEGQTEEAKVNRDLVNSVMTETGMQENDVVKQVTGLQRAMGGLDTESSRQTASQVIRQAQKQGTTADALTSQVASLAEMQGFEVGTDYFGTRLANFTNLGQVGQQQYMRQAGRDYQKYAQWSPYLEGGNGEAYQLFGQLSGTNMAETQAIQSVFSQAQMSGVDLTPGMANSLATQANGMAPFRALDASRIASSLNEIGASSFGDAFSGISNAIGASSFGFSDVGNGTIGRQNGNVSDTFNFIKGVTGANQYALSDYGRMAGIGVLQSMDANGLQTGLKDMSGLLMYANQNTLNQPGLSGSQTLSGLGMTFGSTDQNALLSGGIWGYQQSYVNQTNALQAQTLNMQGEQLGYNRQSTYQSWGLEDKTNAAQWDAQQKGFQWQSTMMDTNNRFRLEDAALTRNQRDASNSNNSWMRDFDYQSSLMKRDWSREDYQFNTQMRSLSNGWQSEDLDEQIRRSSGYDRAQLIKQRDRATLSNNLQGQQAETQFSRQEETWKREDERYQKGVEYANQMIELDTARFELNQKQADEMYTMQKQHLGEEMDTAEKLHDLRMEMEALQRERQEEQMDYQEKSLDIQRQQMKLQNEYQNNMTVISHTQAEMEASLRKITNYSPAFSRMLGDFLTFLEDASQVSIPSGTGGKTYR